MDGAVGDFVFTVICMNVVVLIVVILGLKPCFFCCRHWKEGTNISTLALLLLTVSVSVYLMFLCGSFETAEMKCF